MAAPDAPNRDPRYDPVMKGAAAAWHDLCDAAAQCAAIAADADPAKLTVTGDYQAALDQLNAALVDRALHEVYDAVVRFQKTIDTPTDLGVLIGAGRGENELALIGAVIMLRGQLLQLADAQRQLEARYPADPAG
jgi:hypothetical protein